MTTDKNQTEVVINASAVKRMTETAGWQEFTKQLATWLEDIRDQLEAGEGNADSLRGSAEFIRRAIAWPSVVEAEAEYEND